MKRIHIMMSVNNLEESISFYSHLFGHKPTVLKDNYAKWFLDDPLVNFSIAPAKNKKAGLEHLGIQASSEDELKEIYTNIEHAKGHIREEGHTVCCYAQSEKSWITDPQGIEWETFYTYGESENYYEDKDCCDSTCCNETAEQVEQKEMA